MADRFGVHPAMIAAWKRALIEGAPDIFGKSQKVKKQTEKQVDELYKKIGQPNQVWATDITYIPMNPGFIYLVAVMDWHSSKVLSWRVSNTMEADFCVKAVAEAIERYGAPDIFNTKHGAPFTSEAFTGLLQSNGIAVSMDGRGRCQDNIFIERLWWTLRYNYIYLHSFGNRFEPRNGLRHWFNFYNRDRFHQSLDNLTPDEVYYDFPHPFAEAALCLSLRIGL